MDNGTYTVKARIIDKDDGFTEYTTVVTVNNVVPTVTAPANQSSDEGENKSFSLGSFSDPGTADNPWTVSVNWGDLTPRSLHGRRAGRDLPHHTYDDNGTYTVTYTVTDKDGGVSTPASTFQVTVNNVAPTATLANDGPINEGGSVNVTFSAARPVQCGHYGRLPLRVQLHQRRPFRGDLRRQRHLRHDLLHVQRQRHPHGEGPDHRQGRRLHRVHDRRHRQQRGADRALANNGPVNEGSPATVSFSAQFDPSSDDTAAGFHYAYDCSGGSLAGATYAGSGTSASTACTFADNGTFLVRARIIDKDDGFTEYTTSVVVKNVAPTLTSPGDQTGNESVDQSFNLGSFSDPGTADAPWTVDVNWGDSNSDSFTTGTQGATSHNHTYADSGTYTVTVTVTDKDGAPSNTITFQVTVSNTAPTADLANNSPVNEGTLATITFTNQFDPSATDTAAGFHYAYSCSNGDLSAATYANTAGSTASTTCTYDDGPSTHTVKARIIDKDDGFTEYTTVVTVDNVAPTASLGNNGPVDEGSPATISFAGQLDPSSADTTAGFHYAYACDNGDLRVDVCPGQPLGLDDLHVRGQRDVHSPGPDHRQGRRLHRVHDGRHGLERRADGDRSGQPELRRRREQVLQPRLLHDPGHGGQPVDGVDQLGRLDSPGRRTRSPRRERSRATTPTTTMAPTRSPTRSRTRTAASRPRPRRSTVTVNNVAPTATLANNGPINEGGSVNVSFSDQLDPSNADTAAGFHYAFSCTNGDLSGATYAGSGTSATTSCTFNDNGTFTVRPGSSTRTAASPSTRPTSRSTTWPRRRPLANNGPVNEG